MNTCLIDVSKETSLNDLADDMHTNYGIEITKQGLDQRFNSASVKLMKRCFETVFEKVLDSNIMPNPLYKTYTNLYICCLFPAS